MTRRTIIVFSVVLATLLVVLFLGRLLRNKTVKPAFEKLDISEIGITGRGKDKINLQKEGETWYTGKWPADTGKVNRIADAVKNIRLEDVISTRKEKYSEFEVSGSSAVVVNIGSGIKLYVGKRGSDGTSSFLRVEGDPAVYIVKGINKSMFTTDEKIWRNKDIIAYEKNEIEDVGLEYNGRRYAVDKGTETWADIAHEFKELKAVEFIEDFSGFAKNFRVPYIKIALKLSDKRQVSYSVIKMDKKYFSKPSEHDLVYEVDEKNINNIIKIIKDRLKPVNG